MKHITRLFVAFATLFSMSVLAGLTQPAPVDITLNPDGSGSAMGDMVTARFADNDTEFIGCGNRIQDTGGGAVFEYGFCQGEDIDGDRAFCTTTNPELIDAMRSTSDYSFITFQWNAAGECQYIGFSTQSFYIPEPPSFDFPGRPGRGRGR